MADYLWHLCLVDAYRVSSSDNPDRFYYVFVPKSFLIIYAIIIRPSPDPACLVACLQSSLIWRSGSHISL